MTDTSAPNYPVDRRALRLLAHPFRARILAELHTLGEATASELGRRLDTSSGVTSYHLRSLAEAGLVVHSQTQGRRRYWSAATDERTLDLDGEEPEANDDASVEWLARDYVQHFAGKTQNWITQSTNWPLSWQELCGLDDRLVLVTDEQLAALHEEMTALLARYRRVGAGNPSAKRVTFYTCALPVDAPPRL